MEVKVKGHYRTTRSGKKVFVRAYTSTRGGSTSTGEELLSRKGSLVTFKNWEDFRDEVNNVGWDNMTLGRWSSFSYRNLNGRKVTFAEDPYGGSDKFFGYRVGKKLIATANVSDENGIVYIGNFEVFPSHKRKGYGRKFYKQIERQFKNRHIMLNYLDKRAKKFWMSLGFEESGVGTILEKRLDKSN